MQKSAEGIVSDAGEAIETLRNRKVEQRLCIAAKQTLKGQTVPIWDQMRRSSYPVMSSGIASADETATGEREEDTPVRVSTLMVDV
jgi:hypothetical protein